MVLAAFIGRLPLSMVGLGSVLLIASESGSYGYGGAVAATGAVTACTLAVIGSLLFAAQGKTEPPPHGHEARTGPRAIRTPGIRVLFVVGAAVGAILGTLEIALVAFADEVGAKSLSGLLIAALA